MPWVTEKLPQVKEKDDYDASVLHDSPYVLCPIHNERIKAPDGKVNVLKCDICKWEVIKYQGCWYCNQVDENVCDTCGETFCEKCGDEKTGHCSECHHVPPEPYAENSNHSDYDFEYGKDYAGENNGESSEDNGSQIYNDDDVCFPSDDIGDFIRR